MCERRGESGLRFSCAPGKESFAAEDIDPQLVNDLVSRGINRSSARTLVQQVEEEKVREKIALVDWLVAKKDGRVSRNAAGFLCRAISDDYELPPEYRSARQPAKEQRPERKLVPLQRHNPPGEQTPSHSPDRDAIQAYWSALGPDEQQRIELELVERAPRFLREQYREGEKERGILFRAVRQAMIDGYVKERLFSEKILPAQGANPSKAF